MTSIQDTIDKLRQTLTDYIEATYHIAHPIMVHQRKRLLAAAEGIYQIPYLESTPRYVTQDNYEKLTDIPEAARKAFIRLSDGSKRKPIIYNPPYKHQAEAIRYTLGQN